MPPRLRACASQHRDFLDSDLKLLISVPRHPPFEKRSFFFGERTPGRVRFGVFAFFTFFCSIVVATRRFLVSRLRISAAPFILRLACRSMTHPTAASLAALFAGIDPERRVVLHVDINRTIIQLDAAAGKSLEDVLNNNVADIVVGTVSDANTNNTENASGGEAVRVWTAVGFEGGPEAAAATTPLMTFSAFVDDVLFPRPAGLAALPPKEGVAVFQAIRLRRIAAKTRFTLPGHPGAAYRATYTAMMRAMLRPGSSSAATLAAIDANNNDASPALGPVPLCDVRYVLPGFYLLLSALSLRGAPFTVAFRTFGPDLPDVLPSFVRFVLGCERDAPPPEGPLLAALAAEYRRVLGTDAPEGPVAAGGGDASNAAAERRIGRPVPTGSVYRDASGTFLTWGPTAAPPLQPPGTTIADFYATQPTTAAFVTRCVDCAALYAAVSGSDRPSVAADASSVAATADALGVVDFYPWWAAHGEDGAAGKVFPVLTDSGTEGPPPFQVFFDDNIFFGGPRSIVDPRDSATGEPLVDPSLLRSLLIPVRPLDAITQPDYFVASLARCMREQEARWPRTHV